MGLNERGYAIAEELIERAGPLGGRLVVRGGVRLLDGGVDAAGSEELGLGMARVALGGAGEVSLTPPDEAGAAKAAWPGCPWPTVSVRSDDVVAACLASQYAGWRVADGGFSAMASGPMRAAIGKEDLYETIGLREQPAVAVGLLETAKLPPESVCGGLAAAAGVAPESLVLLVARTASVAGGVQVVARSLETAVHKLNDLGFDLTRIRRGVGTAPLPPVAGDDLTAIGLTNDAVLYGGRVEIEVTGDDESLAVIGPQAVSRASPAFGAAFRLIFEAAGGDFYAIDPAIFAPARLELVNIDTGARHVFGELEPATVAESFAAGGAAARS